MERPVPWVNRVRVVNYKSIAACDVRLGPLTVLIGPNGVGKSNFLDALAFVADAVATTPFQAIEARGGLPEILRRVPEPTDSFSIRLDVTVPWGPAPGQWAHGEYGFEIASRQQRGQRPFEVVSEECSLRWDDKEFGFRVARISLRWPVSLRECRSTTSRPSRCGSFSPSRRGRPLAGAVSISATSSALSRKSLPG